MPYYSKLSNVTSRSPFSTSSMVTLMAVSYTHLTLPTT